MRKTTAIGFLIALIVVIGGAFFFRYSSNQIDAQQYQPPAKSQAITYPVDITAIKPSGTKRATPVLAAGIQPSVTEANVRTYFDTYGFPQAAPGIHPTIEKIVFLTARQASKLMKGESVGRPDNVIVCYVLLKGPFQLVISQPPGRPSATKDSSASPSQASAVHKIEEVFDAYTGNMLLWGTADYTN